MAVPHPASDARLIDSRTAAWRLLVVVLLVTLGNSAMYVVSVVLPAVQAEFGIGRAGASLPYTLMMVCLGIGGLWTGLWADRWGIARVLWLGSAAVGAGYVLAALSGNVWLFGLAHGLLGLLGGAATFAPLMADTGLWWHRRRGIAMAICASGNYIAGTLWPPLAQWGITHYGWRPTYVALGLVCGVGMALLALAMRRRPPALSAHPASHGAAAARATPWPPERPFGLTPAQAQWLLCVAGVACCVAMSMPQVHIVAYCTDLGFGAARGAQMLSLMMAAGIASRLLSGWVSDHIGGLRTLMLGSVVVATLLGVALGGWLSGAVFDWTGTYRAAFVNGIAWNLVNVGIVGFLLLRVHRSLKTAA